MLSHRTPTKPGELRKNEPNPMGLLAPIGKLVNHLTEDLVLRIQKSNEVRIGHPRSVVQAMAVLECDCLAMTPALPHLRHLSLLTKMSSRRSRFHKGVWRKRLDQSQATMLFLLARKVLERSGTATPVLMSTTTCTTGARRASAISPWWKNRR